MDIDPAVELAVLEAEDLRRAEENNRRRQELLELERKRAAEKKAREEAAEARRREEEAREEARKKEEAAKKAAEAKARATKPKLPKKVSSTLFSVCPIYSFVFIAQVKCQGAGVVGQASCQLVKGDFKKETGGRGEYFFFFFFFYTLIPFANLYFF